jgi:regulator of replication initiation timing
MNKIEIKDKIRYLEKQIHGKQKEVERLKKQLGRDAP